MQDYEPNPSVVLATEQISAERFVDFAEYSAAADIVRDSIEAVIDA